MTKQNDDYRMKPGFMYVAPPGAEIPDSGLIATPDDPWTAIPVSSVNIKTTATTFHWESPEMTRWRLTLSCSHTVTEESDTEPSQQTEYCTACGGDKYVDEVKED